MDGDALTTPEPSRWTEWDALHALRAAPQLLAQAAALAGGELSVQRTLRGRFAGDLVRAALTQRDLRNRAAGRFADAERMWFSRTGLEQATTEAVARHKAQRFHGLVWDYCCGIGSDAIALAGHAQVIAVDQDPAACLRTRWNAEACGAPAVAAVCARVEELADRSGLVHVDPDRRAARQSRVVRIEDYVPGYDFLQRLTGEFEGGAIKLSPAANFGGKFPGCEIELVSLDGECKEATVWFGALCGEFPWRATVLPNGATLAADPLSASAEQRELGRYLYDPDPAIVRSGLLEVAAEQLGLGRLDPQEEYLTADEVIVSPFVRGFEVIAEMSNNPREIAGWFRKSGCGQVEIKCRRIPVDVEALRRRLPLPGKDSSVLFLARLGGRARAIVARRLPAR